MIRNYLRPVLRSFARERVYSLINLAGLAVGLASVFILMAYVRYELSFDKHYTHSDRVYRVAIENTRGGIVNHTLFVPDGLIPALQQQFPEVEAGAHLSKPGIDVRHGDEILTIWAVQGDSSLLRMFNIPLVEGNAASMVADGDIVLTEALAKKLFPGHDAVGQTLVSPDGKDIYTVKGLIRLPANTHFSGEAIEVHPTRKQALNMVNSSCTGNSYVMLHSPGDAEKLLAKLGAFYKKYGFKEGQTIGLQPVTSIHLGGHVEGEVFESSTRRNVYIFSTVAFLILLTACINYINVSTARSVRRIREAGVRKVLGAGPGALALQFVLESVVFFLSTLPVAILLSWLCWPAFSFVIGIPAAGIGYLLNFSVLLAAIGLCLVCGLLSGLYPALILARVRPALVLKGWQTNFRVNLDIRKSLIVFQFVVSIGLIISTIVVTRQLRLLNTMDLGFNQDHLMTTGVLDLGQKGEAFKAELKKNAHITDVSISSWKVGENYGGAMMMDSRQDSGKRWIFGLVVGDLDFFRTAQLSLTEGRSFSPAYGVDLLNIDSIIYGPGAKQMKQADLERLTYSRPLMITEHLGEAIGLKTPYVGQVLKYNGMEGTIIGVVKDFKGVSLLAKSSLVEMRVDQHIEVGYVYARVAPQDVAGTIAYVERVYKRMFPGRAFDFGFVDERIQALYTSQQRLAEIFGGFSVLAILISALGLFSLLAVTVQQKTKEIGIRKVLGASVRTIVGLLSGEFVRLVVIAVLIASPLAWWSMDVWLRDFEYRTTIPWWVYPLAGAAAVGVALLAVVGQALRAARANPVESLRME